MGFMGFIPFFLMPYVVVTQMVFPPAPTPVPSFGRAPVNSNSWDPSRIPGDYTFCSPDSTNPTILGQSFAQNFNGNAPGGNPWLPFNVVDASNNPITGATTKMYHNPNPNPNPNPNHNPNLRSHNTFHFNTQTRITCMLQYMFVHWSECRKDLA